MPEEITEKSSQHYCSTLKKVLMMHDYDQTKGTLAKGYQEHTELCPMHAVHQTAGAGNQVVLELKEREGDWK